MTDGLASIITQLERQRAAIDRALVALREVEGSDAPNAQAPASTATVETSGRRGKNRSAAARRKMALAQKARWAKIGGESEPPAPVTKEAAKPKRRISAEGIKRIIAATKKRWRLKRTEAKATQV
jgi:hypothetical protein